MTFNQRVVKHHDKDADTTYFAIHEVHYTDDGSIEAITEKPIFPIGDTFEDLAEEIQHIAKALDYEVLDYNGLVEMLKNDKNN